MDLKRLGIDDKRVHIFDEIDSTNLEAMRRARETAPLDTEIDSPTNKRILQTQLPP